MQFNNNSGNNRESVNVNTRAIQFMNRNGFYPSTLLLGYWNDMLSLKIHPALEESQQTDNKTFNYNDVIPTAVTVEKAIVLVDRIEKDVYPAIEQKKEIFRGVPIGEDSLIGVGVRLINDEPAAYFAIFKALDESTKKPEVAAFYHFRTGYTVDNYDPKSGQFDVTQGVQGELMRFVEALKAANIGLSNATAHATRTVDRYFRERMSKQLDEIGSKLGVAPSKQGSSFSNRGGGRGVFSSNGGNRNTNQQTSSKSDFPDFDAPMETIEGLEGLDEFE